MNSTRTQSDDIVHIVGRYLPLRRMGRGYACRCPFHDGTRATFFVSPQKQEFYCRECFRFGDAAHFVELIEWRSETP